MKKRLLSLVLAAVMVISLAGTGVTALAEEASEETTEEVVEEEDEEDKESEDETDTGDSEDVVEEEDIVTDGESADVESGDTDTDAVDEADTEDGADEEEESSEDETEGEGSSEDEEGIATASENEEEIGTVSDVTTEIEKTVSSSDVTPGETVKFTLTSNVPRELSLYLTDGGSYEFIFHDSMNAVFTCNKDFVVKINGVTLDSSYYSVTYDAADGCSFHITMNLVEILKTGLYFTESEIENCPSIVVTYTAVVSNSAYSSYYSNASWVSYENSSSSRSTVRVKVWDLGKTATELTNDSGNYVSKVTLSIPADEEELSTDVVFVLDESSCNDAVKASVKSFLDDLYEQVQDTGASVKIGLVQFRGEVVKVPLQEITEDTWENVVKTFMDERPFTGGSNMSAGLIAGMEMLEEDDSVDDSRKYLILISDGITYIWDEEDTEEQENYGVNFASGDTPDTPMLASPDGWTVKHDNDSTYIPDDWTSYFDEEYISIIEKTVSEKKSIYVRNTDISDAPFISYSEKDDYASTVDISLYKSLLLYKEASEKYNTFVVASGEDEDIATYPFGMSFMNYLATGETVADISTIKNVSGVFEDIKNEIFYVLYAGTYVEDYMGYVEDYYDFDFVNDASKLSLTLGDTTYGAVQISENVYGFVPVTFDDGTSGYAFTLTYSKGNGTNEEHFVLTVNVDVSNFERIKLTYYVVLADIVDEAGTYGIYDADGSENDGSADYSLYTNNSATLYPKDRGSVPFPKPTVSYTVTASTTTTTTTTTTTSSSSSSTASVSSAQTGDSSNTVLWVALITVAAAGIAVVGVVYFEKRKVE